MASEEQHTRVALDKAQDTIAAGSAAAAGHGMAAADRMAGGSTLAEEAVGPVAGAVPGVPDACAAEGHSDQRKASWLEERMTLSGVRLPSQRGRQPRIRSASRVRGNRSPVDGAS
jgi:hypothetical protein